MSMMSSADSKLGVGVDPKLRVEEERQFVQGRVTITRWLFDQFRLRTQQEGATGDFTALVMEIISAAKLIAMYVNKGPKLGILGVLGSANATGDMQKPLDVLSNDVFLHAMGWNGSVRAMVSEENDDFVPFASSPDGRYLLATDPLDGSSNIDVNVSVGTIFSILRAPPKGTPVTREHFKQPGRHQVAAGYILYGPQTTLVMTLNESSGVNAFTLDQDVGEFFLTSQNMRVKPSCAEFAINCSRMRHWEPPVRRYVDECIAGKDGPRKKDFNMRWVGSMVADVHRILHRGGIFLYPGDNDLHSRGLCGKLRLLYEINPMALLIERAGGRACTGRSDCLDVLADGIHAKNGVILGSREEVELVMAYFKEYDAAHPDKIPECVKKLELYKGGDTAAVSP